MKRITKFAVTVSSAICIAFPLASCGTSSVLDSPTGFSLDENYNLTWSPVVNARSYLVDIKNVETGAVEEATSRRESVALAYLETGDYDIRIRAVGDGSHFYDSDWSTVVSFNRAYESGCTYRLINNGLEYEVASAVVNAPNIVLEDSYRGKPVTSLGVNSFRNAQYLESVAVGNHVTSIGNDAFYNCVALKNITLPDSVASIGESAFQYCRTLESFKTPAGVKELKKAAFAYCRGLKEIDLGNVTAIREFAFSNCTALEVFTLDGVVSVGKDSFANATALKEVTIGDSLVSVGEGAFSGCSALGTVNFGDRGNLQSIGSRAFSKTALTEARLPEGLVRIGSQAFYGAKALENVSIPASVTVVGEYAFHDTKIYRDAAEGNKRLVYADHWLVQTIPNEENPIKNLYAADDGSAETEVIEAETVGIADRTFIDSSVQDVILPNSVKYLGAGAFNLCEELYRFDASDRGSKLEIVDQGAFAYCELLEEVRFNTLDPQLKVIGDMAFAGCKGFNYTSSGATDFIPSSVERIGSKAFVGTGFYGNGSNIKDGVVYADNWAVGCTGSYTFDKKENRYVKPAVTYSDIELKSDVKGIADFAFNACFDIERITNSTKVQIIGAGAFYNCIHLNGFAMTANVSKIEDYTFYNCYNLVINELPRNLRSIGRSAFYNCKQMQTVKMPSRLESVGMFAYYGCMNLTSLTIGSSLTEISPYTFYGCESLSSVTVPSNIRSIGQSAFSRCSGMEELIIEDGVETIGDYAFRFATALSEINLPDSVKSVGKGAFLQCESVKSIDLGSVETIGDFAFAENLGVISLVIPDSVKSVGKGAFCYLGAGGKDENGDPLGSVLQSVIVCGKPGSVGAHAFYGCYNATILWESENGEEEWGTGWNSSRRPTVWGVTLSEDNGYVDSLTVGEDTFQYFSVLNWIGKPFRKGYKFVGWSTVENSFEVAYSMQNVMNAPVGTVLYAVYIHE